MVLEHLESVTGTSYPSAVTLSVKVIKHIVWHINQDPKYIVWHIDQRQLHIVIHIDQNICTLFGTLTKTSAHCLEHFKHIITHIDHNIYTLFHTLIKISNTTFN